MVMKGRDAVAISAGAAGDAAGTIVEANVLGLGGRERGKRGQECDGDESHGRSHRLSACPRAGLPFGWCHRLVEDRMASHCVTEFLALPVPHGLASNLSNFC